MSTKRSINKASVQSIMSKRVTVPANMVGKRVRLLIQGQGNTLDVTNKAGELVQSITEPGTVLRKTIFNVRANSGLAMTNERNIGYLKAGLAAEKAGDADAASQNFSDYLNATQMSFGILLPNALVEQGLIANGVEIAATVQKITTDNGELLTIDPSSISVMAPATLETTDFDINMFDEVEKPKGETPAEKKARIKAEQALAKK